MKTSAPAVDIRLIQKWLRDAGRIALSGQSALHSQEKPDHTLLTNIDQQVEAFLLERISKHYPGHNILSEEGGTYPGESEFMWIVDPIDGTRAYASGLPIWGISIGILCQGEPYAGAFWMPRTGDMYWSNQNQAVHNGKQLPRRRGVNIHHHLAFIAVPSNTHLYYEISFPRIRSLGSTTAHLAYVAQGTALAALTRQIKIWDVAALLAVLNLTGIALIYLSGKPFHIQALLEGRSPPEPVVAAPSEIIDDVRRLIFYKPDRG
jgi:myo-inositol-1(or 4)-monophosphatase